MTQAAPKHESDDIEGSDIPERIIVAARECFERQGFKKTRIEDIAEAVGVVRQTVYNHFSSKQDIIDKISYREMMQVQENLRDRVPHKAPFAERVTEVILQSVLLSLDNPYLNRISTDPEASPLSKGSGIFFKWRQERWRSTLEFGRSSSELRPDITDEQIVTWFSYCQWSLLLRMIQAPMTENELRSFIRDFMVETILSHHGATPAQVGSDLVALQSRVSELKETVVDQALEIKALRALVNRR